LRRSRRKTRQYSADAGNFITNRHLRLRIDRQIHIHARTKADKAIAFAARQFRACLGVAQNTARHQTGHLNKSNFTTRSRSRQHRITFVFRAGLVQIRIHEFAFVIDHFRYRTIGRRFLRMHVEHVHKNTDFQSIDITIRIACALDHHDTAVNRTQHRLRILRNFTRRVAEKLQCKYGKHPKRQRPPAAAHRHQQAQSQTAADNRPALTGDNRVGIQTVHHLSFI